jgi:hypothetical protein
MDGGAEALFAIGAKLEPLRLFGLPFGFQRGLRHVISFDYRAER